MFPWPEFPFPSLEYDGVQNFLLQHRDIKFRTVNMYSKNLDLLLYNQTNVILKSVKNEHE
jgi:hypothetical protein